jgi:N-methylhydantoinase B/oxoprolinase/acetone carboxylase alpha subunit
MDGLTRRDDDTSIPAAVERRHEMVPTIVDQFGDVVTFLAAIAFVLAVVGRPVLDYVRAWRERSETTEESTS